MSFGYPPAPPTVPIYVPPAKKKRSWVAQLFIILFSMLIGFMLGAAAGAKPEPTAPRAFSPAVASSSPWVVSTPTKKASSPVVTAVKTTAKPVAPAVIVIKHPADFGDEFDKNKVSATKKYKGKRVQIRATLTNINDDRLTFGGITTEEFSLTQIACNLDDESQAEKVVNGMRYTIVGTVTGQDFGVIGFNDCVVQK